MESCAFKIASSRTSGLKIIPGPPEIGLSSTCLCIPRPYCRKSIISKDQSFFFNALPVTEANNGPGKSSGYSVITLAFNLLLFIFFD